MPRDVLLQLTGKNSEGNVIAIPIDAENLGVAVGVTELAVDVDGGGTGAITAAAARTNLPIGDLTAVTTPAATDVFESVQGAVSKKQTRAQIHALESGEHLVLPQVDEVATPTLAFGDGDSGFYESADDVISVAVLGVEEIAFDSDGIRAADAAGGQLLNEAATATNPTLVSNRADIDTGVGWRAANIGVLVGGALNCIEFANVGAAAAVGFYGTGAIVLQTGVAVTAGGVHAALVNLGLITA